MEDDSHISGSDYLSEFESINEPATLKVAALKPTLPILSQDFEDTYLMGRRDVRNNYVVEKDGTRPSGWYGLDAINHGLIGTGLTAVKKRRHSLFRQGQRRTLRSLE